MKEYIERAVAVQELEVLRQEYEMHDDCDELVARRCRDALSAALSALRPVSRECGNKAAKKIVQEVLKND